MITSPIGSRPASTSETPGAYARDAQPLTSDRFGRAGLAPAAAVIEEDVLVIDDRSTLSPAQAVENRLSRILSDASLPVSHLQMRGLLRRR